ncbi:MAG: NAD(P)/FAD-dependent oxidoreductase [Candidatus Nanohalarchaeota archaeon]|nr:MAG: NAD(P)/FAD-dependent oxidoreductase [Candidatus Nanohaloarchaeota archaeon]
MLSTFNVKEKYDVIIIGAGPGGSRLGQLCAQKGLDVLMIEKRPEIGAPKRCAEGLSEVQLKQLGFTGKERFVVNTIYNGSILYGPSGQSIYLPAKNEIGYILERKLFDKELAGNAARAGAKIITNAEVIGMIKENDFVCGVELEYYGEKHKIKSDIVVSAEGVEAKFAREVLNIAVPKPNEVMSGYQYELENITMEDSKRLELYAGRDICPGGYIWIFPKGEKRANVGLGIFSNCEKSAKYYLDQWIGTKNNLRCGSVLEENGGAIPVGGLLRKMTANGFLAVGDAARQVHPMHGGGMHEATYAAKIAADVINEAKISNDYSAKFLDRYNKTWWHERGNELLKVNRIKEIFHKMSDDDLNTIMDILKDRDIDNIIKGNLTEISKIFLKIPKLIKFSKYLI